MCQANNSQPNYKKSACIDRVKEIQTELREAIVAGEYKKVDTLMELLELSLIELEDLY